MSGWSPFASLAKPPPPSQPSASQCGRGRRPRAASDAHPPASPGFLEPKLSKKAKQRKGEYLRSLEEDNRQLKETILQFEQKIATIQAENDILLQQLQFFQGHLTCDKTPSDDTERT
jgi:hypothetical protein